MISTKREIPTLRDRTEFRRDGHRKGDISRQVYCSKSKVTFSIKYENVFYEIFITEYGVAMDINVMYDFLRRCCSYLQYYSVHTTVSISFSAGLEWGTKSKLLLLLLMYLQWINMTYFWLYLHFSFCVFSWFRFIRSKSLIFNQLLLQ